MLVGVCVIGTKIKLIDGASSSDRENRPFQTKDYYKGCCFLTEPLFMNFTLYNYCSSINRRQHSQTTILYSILLNSHPSKRSCSPTQGSYTAAIVPMAMCTVMNYKRIVCNM